MDPTTLLGYLGVGSDTTALGNISELLGTLGITIPLTGDLSLSGLITDVLSELGKTVPSTGDLSLANLLSDLGVGGLNVGSLLNSVTLGDPAGRPRPVQPAAEPERLGRPVQPDAGRAARRPKAGRHRQYQRG